MTGDVADRDPEPVVEQREHGVPVAADCGIACRPRCSGPRCACLRRGGARRATVPAAARSRLRSGARALRWPRPCATRVRSRRSRRPSCRSGCRRRRRGPCRGTRGGGPSRPSRSCGATACTARGPRAPRSTRATHCARSSGCSDASQWSNVPPNSPGSKPCSSSSRASHTVLFVGDVPRPRAEPRRFERQRQALIDERCHAQPSPATADGRPCYCRRHPFPGRPRGRGGRGSRYSPVQQPMIVAATVIADVRAGVGRRAEHRGQLVHVDDEHLVVLAHDDGCVLRRERALRRVRRASVRFGRAGVPSAAEVGAGRGRAAELLHRQVHDAVRIHVAAGVVVIDPRRDRAVGSSSYRAPPRCLPGRSSPQIIFVDDRDDRGVRLERQDACRGRCGARGSARSTRTRRASSVATTRRERRCERMCDAVHTSCPNATMFER